MTNTTAAQPLDLDSLETAALAVENAATSDGEAAAYEELRAFLSARVVLALIAQARAAQPAESIDQPIGHLSPAIGQPDAAICQPQGATGTTGADEHRTAAAELLKYLDDHDWGGIPEGATADRLRAALARNSHKLSEQSSYDAQGVKPWRERLYMGYDECDKHEAMEAEIANLRAQLAAKGQGNVKFDLTDYNRAVNYANGTSAAIGPDDLADMIPQSAVVQQDGDVRRVCMTYAELKQFAQLAAKSKGEPVGYVHLVPDEFSKEYDVRFWTKVPMGTKLYLSAPASAQPDRGAARGADVCAEMRALCPNCGGTGEVHRADGEYVGTCDCMFQTIASLASQPVAPANDGWLIALQTAVEMPNEKKELGYTTLDGIGVFTSQDDAMKSLAELRLPLGWVVMHVNQLIPGYIMPEVAVAPSDAKGKAEMHIIKFVLELAEQENDDAAVSFLKAWNNEDAGYLRANWPDFDGATSAADAKDGSDAK